MQNNLSEDELFALLICSQRYAYGRMTYVVSEIASIIQKNFHLLDPNHQYVLVKDLKESLKNRYPGMDMDKETWDYLLEFYENREVDHG